jgi:FtsP/CotA-like multicopper oxidase with cupredoxin domain
MVDPATGNLTTTELPFYQIGAEQGFLPKVVKIQTGSATELPGDGTIPATLPALNPEQALLMTLAERADVLVDFRQIPNGTRVRLINTGPDEHFVGFPLTPANISNPDTTGQVLEFVIDDTITGASPTDPTGATPATDPWGLVLSFEGGLGPRVGARNVALKEEASSRVCIIHDMNPGNPPTFISYLPAGLTEDQVMSECAKLGARPLEMKAVKLGTVDLSNPALPKGVPLLWNDPRGMTETVTLQSGAQIPVTVTENPTVGAIEEWDLYNFTSDAHPIHLHLVRFQVMERSPIPGMSSAPLTESVQPWEKGFKDTVIAYPGMITKVKAKFDIAGLYVWHCHIVEHEDNEMMRPFYVSNVQIYFPLILALNARP